MIIIHSDAGSGGRAEESWMDRDKGGREGAVDLVGKDVKNGPWCQEIEQVATSIPSRAGANKKNLLASYLLHQLSSSKLSTV